MTPSLVFPQQSSQGMSRLKTFEEVNLSKDNMKVT
jgi:hypothetical protein